ncbi:hypothetical protein V6N11_055123 [Hibiscus sabdariffa]|uniref:Uncharacterized protein n=1 Tax=Hibiscus sabdariffa TaxID=183260 RepID=A0ABR2N9B0_9ROSI
MAKPRRCVRGVGQAPIHLDEVEIEHGVEETLPPPPPVFGEANEGGAGPQGGVGPQVAQGPTVERLRKLGGVEFNGLSPERSEAWLESTIRILGKMECTDARKLGCVVSLLQGDAYAWWTMVISSLDEDYEIQFVRLSQYAPESILMSWLLELRIYSGAEDFLLELAGLAEVRDQLVGIEIVPIGTRIGDISLSLGVGVVTPGEATRAKGISIELLNVLGVVGAVGKEGERIVKVKDLKPKRIKGYLKYPCGNGYKEVTVLPSRDIVYDQAKQLFGLRHKPITLQDALPRSDSQPRYSSKARPLSLFETSPLSSC